MGPSSAPQAALEQLALQKLKLRLTASSRREINILRLCAGAIQALAGFADMVGQTTPGEPMSMSESSAKAVADSLFSASLAEADPEIADVIGKELGRQRDEIELIASENIVSRAVLEAQGSVLTNKYAEGLPGKRYYGGCQFVDIAENLALDRVKKLFGAEHANVQPHSGASANVAAFFALMQPGDTFLGLNLAAGGHLSHGSPVNIPANGSRRCPMAFAATTTASTWRRCEARRAAQAQGHRCRRLGLSTHHRLPQIP